MTKNMPFNDGIDRKYCYSLTDFHDFDFCQFRFYVRHHLERKAEIDEGSEQMALGSLLDQSIKKFHLSKAYGVSSDYLPNIVAAAANYMREQVAQKGPQSFFGSSVPFLNEGLIKRAADIFKSYHQRKEGKIRKSLGEVGFCEWIIEGDPSTDRLGNNDLGKRYKLWGGPDTLEMGDDGVVEVVDYKSRENLDKENLDMDLMPKIYTLLVAKKLLGMGHKRARFVVRIWQDPLDESMYEEFDLTSMNGEEFLFKQKIGRILANKEVRFCERDFCKACKSKKREQYLEELKKAHGLSIMSKEEFLENG